MLRLQGVDARQRLLDVARPDREMLIEDVALRLLTLGQQRLGFGKLRPTSSAARSPTARRRMPTSHIVTSPESVFASSRIVHSMMLSSDREVASVSRPRLYQPGFLALPAKISLRWTLNR